MRRDRLPQNEIFSFVNASGRNNLLIFTNYGTRIAEVIFKAEIVCERKRKYFAHMRWNWISVLLRLIHSCQKKQYSFYTIFIVFGDQLNSVTTCSGVLCRLTEIDCQFGERATSGVMRVDVINSSKITQTVVKGLMVRLLSLRSSLAA